MAAKAKRDAEESDRGVNERMQKGAEPMPGAESTRTGRWEHKERSQQREGTTSCWCVQSSTEEVKDAGRK